MNQSATRFVAFRFSANPVLGRRLASATLVGLTLLASLAVGPAHSQSGTGVIRVSPGGSNFSGCGGAGSPCRTVQRAVSETSSGFDVIRLEVGTYDDTTTCLGTTAVACVLNKHVAIEGGFSGGNWTTPTLDAGATVLDGRDLNRVILAQDTQPSGPSLASLSLTGLTVTRGFDQGAASGSDTVITTFGGGINATAAPIYLENVVVSYNRILGGGSAGSSPVNDHGGSGAGGGIALLGTAKTAALTSTLLNVRFIGNTAEGGDRPDSGNKRGGYGQGGGLFTFNARLDGSGVEFRDNLALGGDATSASGSDSIGQEGDAQGAGACIQVGSTVELDGVLAVDNFSRGGDASNSSGSLAGGSFGAAIFVEQATLTIRNGHFARNESRGGDANIGGFGAGGALGAAVATFNLDRVTVVDNVAGGGDGTNLSGTAGGGAAYLAGGTVDVVNSVFSENHLELGNTGAPVGGGGGAFFMQTTSVDVVHGTFSGNSVPSSMQGHAIVMIGGASGAFDYSIFSDHTVNHDAAVHAQGGNTASFDRGMFSNNHGDTAGGGSFPGLGTMLSAADIFYQSPGAPNFDYHLAANSPAIGMADGSGENQDLDSEARSDADIGADEYSTSIFADGFESGATVSWK